MGLLCIYYVICKQWKFLSFPSWISLFLFILWLLWLGLPKWYKIMVVRMDTLIFFLILRKVLLVFHHWELCILWVCHIWPLLRWGSFCLCPFSGEFLFLIINGCRILSKGFLHLLRLSDGFYLSNYLYSVSHWLICIYQNPCIPGINPTGSWFMIVVYDCFLIVIGFYLLVFCSWFLHLYPSVILTCNFVLWFLCLVLVSGYCWTHRMSLGVFPFSAIFGKVWEE